MSPAEQIIAAILSALLVGFIMVKNTMKNNTESVNSNEQRIDYILLE